MHLSQNVYEDIREFEMIFLKNNLKREIHFRLNYFMSLKNIFFNKALRKTKRKKSFEKNRKNFKRHNIVVFRNRGLRYLKRRAREITLFNHFKRKL